jgi:TetR/AcrR family transcriptional repressor of mexJK operon
MSQFAVLEHGPGIDARIVPRGEKRRRQLAAVAERMFLERGFGATTMQIIASEAGASKETLYRHFTSKESLFAEIVRARAAEFLGSEGELEGPPREVLAALAANIVARMFDPSGMSLLRIVVGETARAPELGRIFYRQGPAVILDRITRYLRSADRRGVIRCRDPRQAAKLFVGATVADFHLVRLMLPATRPLSESQTRAHVRAVIAMFFARYGAPAP